jgi:hypothetical protein
MAGYSARAKRCHTNVPDPLMAHMILIPLHDANLAAARHHYCFSLLYRTSGDFDIGVPFAGTRTAHPPSSLSQI